MISSSASTFTLPPPSPPLERPPVLGLDLVAVLGRDRFAVDGRERFAVDGRDRFAVDGRDLEVLAVDGRDLEELEGRADRTALIPLPLPFGPAVAGRLLLLSGERN